MDSRSSKRSRVSGPDSGSDESVSEHEAKGSEEEILGVTEAVQGEVQEQNLNKPAFNETGKVGDELVQDLPDLNEALVDPEVVGVEARHDGMQQQEAGNYENAMHPRNFKLAEIRKLVDEVKSKGGKKWAAISKVPDFVGRKDEIALKDKWRNLVEWANMPADKRKNKLNISEELFDEVRDLEELYKKNKKK